MENENQSNELPVVDRPGRKARPAGDRVVADIRITNDHTKRLVERQRKAAGEATVTRTATRLLTEYCTILAGKAGKRKRK